MIEMNEIDASREVGRLFKLFQNNWEAITSGLDFGVKVEGYGVWRENGNQFIASVSLVDDDDHCPVDEFSIWVCPEKKKHGWVIRYELGYMHDGDEVTGSNDVQIVKSMFMSGIQVDGVKVLVHRAHSSIGQVPILDE